MAENIETIRECIQKRIYILETEIKNLIHDFGLINEDKLLEKAIEIKCEIMDLDYMFYKKS